MRKMKITIYAKKRTTKDGKTFHVYLSKLTKKDGTETPVTVHFRMTAGLPNPDKCPCVIEFYRKNGNVSKKERHFAKTDVVTGEIYEETSIDTQLWISEYKLCEGEYTDTSMDEFAD